MQRHRARDPYYVSAIFLGPLHSAFIQMLNNQETGLLTLFHYEGTGPRRAWVSCLKSHTPFGPVSPQQNRQNADRQPLNF